MSPSDRESACASASACGSGRAVAGPLEERRAEPRLEPAHLVADRRLGDAELVRRPAEAAVAGDGLEGAERAERRLGHLRPPWARSCFPEKPSFDKRPGAQETAPSSRRIEDGRRLLTRERLQDFTRNGPKVAPTFSAAEMQRRLDAIRGAMAKAGIDAALFTSYHNINYYSDFLYCYFGRRYGLVVTPDASTSISAGIDGGQPARRTFGEQRHLHRLAEGQLLPRRPHADRRRAAASASSSTTSTSTREPARGRVPRHGVRRHRRPRDAAAHDQVGRGDRATSPRWRRIADIGGAACVEAIAVGAPEHEVALHSTATHGARDRPRPGRTPS